MNKRPLDRGVFYFYRNFNMLSIAHRGAKGYEPENTLSAFGKALELGCDGIELDVHLSRDGAIIVIHDDTVNRTTNGDGEVAALSLNELKKLQCDNGTEIPTLDEVFDFIDKKCLVNIELKGYETWLPVAILIEKSIAEDNWKYADFLVSSFDWNALQELRKYNPKIPIGVLTQTDLDLAIGFSEFIKAETIHPYFHLLTSRNIAQMQQKGLKVFAWTINEREDIGRLESYNVDGIISDYPDRL